MTIKMNYSLVFFSCLYFTISAQTKVDLEYRLKYFGNNIVHVTLLYTPIEKDSTEFTYGEPRFGGQSDIIKCITNVSVVSKIRFITDTASRSFKFFYSGTRPFAIEYDILDTVTAKKDLRQELFRPMIQKNYFYSHGINLFLNPKFNSPDKKATVSIQWVKSPTFPIFYGFGPENRGKKKVISTTDSVMFSLITGAKDLTIDKFDLHGTQNYLVLRGNAQEKYNRLAIRNYFIQFNESIRKFWNDYSDKYFSLILQPFLEADHSVSGVAYSNGFIGKYKADTILNAQRIYTISHEIGHHWIGHQLEMNISNQWFGEGFNDYITFYTLLSGGLMSPHEFENRMNEIFTAHYSSTIKNTPNDSVFLNYWKMGDYNKLPYRRGSIFAFYLDNQIRLATNGEKTIKDFLRSMAQFRKRKTSNYEITIEDFIDQAAAFLPRPKLESIIEDYIVKGNPILFSNELLLPVYQVTNENDIPHISIVDEKKFIALFL
ncbi:MAG: hypothetical protein ABI761_11925 [Saprospiraceae bacterium]